MKWTFIVVLICTMSIGCSESERPDIQPDPKPIVLSCDSLNKDSLANLSIDRDYFRRQVEILSNDSMKGRWVQQNGIDKTRDYLKQEFEKVGLLEFQGSYQDDFTLRKTYPEQLSVTINDELMETGKLILMSGVNARQNLTDFEVHYFTEDKSLSEQVLSFFGESRADNHLVVVPEKLTEEFEEYRNRLIHLQVLKPNLTLFDDKYAYQRANAHIIFLLSDMVSVETVKASFEFGFNSFANITGMISGTGNKYLIIGAHMDHLGVITHADDSIMNGANDNASGIAALLSMAKFFRDQDLTSSLNLIFIAFDTEEVGLLGSNKFIEQYQSLDIAGMINIDMIANPTDSGKAYIIGSDLTNFPSIAEDVYDCLDLIPFASDEGLEFISHKRFDSYSFHEYGVPALSISTFNGENYAPYHTPEDEISEIDYDIAYQTTENLLVVLHAIANEGFELKNK